MNTKLISIPMMRIATIVAVTSIVTAVDAQTGNDGNVRRELMSASAPHEARAPIFVAPIKHIGSPVKTSPLKEGGSLPFVQALRTLAPEGWAAWEGNDLVSALPATIKFPPGKLWYDALGDALFAEGLRADIDWAQKRIVIRSQPSAAARVTPAPSSPWMTEPARATPATPVAPSALTVRETARTSPPASVLNAGERLMPASANTIPPIIGAAQLPIPLPLPPTPGQRPTTEAVKVAEASGDGPSRFQLRAQDKTIRQAFTRWAGESGWSLVYDATNYSFEVPLDIEADFRDAVCAVIVGINKDIDESPATEARRYLDAGFWPANKAARVFTERADLVVAAPEGTCRRPGAMLRPFGMSDRMGSASSDMPVRQPVNRDAPSTMPRTATSSTLLSAKANP
jgi:hypothetical protein